MSKRELNISDKPLHQNTKEDIILKSPLKIPPKELEDLVNLKGINSSNIAYYDISPTEKQAIRWRDSVKETWYNIIGHSSEEGRTKMGNFKVNALNKT